jgi:hypothetical protein
MPRKLPWLVDDDVKERKKSKSRLDSKSDVELPQKSGRVNKDQNEDHISDDSTRGVDLLRSCRFTSHQTLSKKLSTNVLQYRCAARSPPTSPIQAPLKEESVTFINNQQGIFESAQG